MKCTSTSVFVIGMCINIYVCFLFKATRISSGNPDEAFLNMALFWCVGKPSDRAEECSMWSVDRVSFGLGEGRSNLENFSE